MIRQPELRCRYQTDKNTCVSTVRRCNRFPITSTKSLDKRGPVHCLFFCRSQDLINLNIGVFLGLNNEAIIQKKRRMTFLGFSTPFLLIKCRRHVRRTLRIMQISWNHVASLSENLRSRQRLPLSRD